MNIINRACSFGRYYVIIAPQASGAPLVDRCFTYERQPPHRRGEGVMIRPPFMRHRPTLALVLGRWLPNPTDVPDLTVGSDTSEEMAG